MIGVELNSTTDNPLLEVSSGKIYQGGNFQATSMAMSMDTLKMALQHMGKIMHA